MNNDEILDETSNEESKEEFSGKEYKIRTVQDIVDIVDSKNIHRFLDEFSKVLVSIVAIKDIGVKHGIEGKLEIPEIDWKDDGSNKTTVTLVANDGDKKSKVLDLTDMFND